MSSVIEEFFILFNSDASRVEKETKKAKKSTDDLAASLNSADGIGNNLGNRLQDIVKKYGGVIAAAISLKALFSQTAEAAQYAYQLGQISDVLGENIEDLSAWGDAVVRSGGSADAFQGTLVSLSESLNSFSLATNNETAIFLARFGISLMDTHGKAKKVLDLLPELAGGFEKMSKQQSFSIGKKLGLDQGTILLLQRGKMGVQELIAKQKELGVATKEAAENARKFNEAWTDTAHAFRTVFLAVSHNVLPVFPAIAKALEGTAKFFQKHSTFITGLMIALGTSILVFVVPPLLTAAAAAIALYAPFLLIGAAVAAVSLAFALLYDDISVFLEGGNSITGDFLKKWPAVAEVVRGVGTAFKELWGIVKPILGFMWDGLKGILGIVDSLLGGIMSVIGDVVGVVSTVVSSAATGFGLGEEGKENLAQKYVSAGKNTLDMINTNPISSQSSTSISSSKSNSSNSSVSVGEIKIETQATDAKGISREIGSSLKGQLNEAIFNSNDGVVI